VIKWCLENDKIRFGYELQPEYVEKIEVKMDGTWVPALSSSPYVTTPSDERHFAIYALEGTTAREEKAEEGCKIILDHPERTVIREIKIAPQGDILDVRVTYHTKKDTRLRALEDIWNFMPKRRDEDNELSGPLDFVWSQRMKSFSTSFIPHYSFKCPLVMMQQGGVFTALAAGLEGVDAESLEKVPLGMDLDVTRDPKPWMSYGAVVSMLMTPNRPCEAGHSQIVRGVDEEFWKIVLKAEEEISYHYSIIASVQPKKLGYRYAVHYIWNRYGTKSVAMAENLPNNKRYPGVCNLSQWEQKIWEEKGEEDYFSIEENGVTMGGLTGRRQGEWFSKTDYKHDVWYACWLQELVSGYGMHLYGKKKQSEKWVDRTEQILNWILSAPRTHGMFPVICYYESDGTKTWLNDDGWAGYYQDFHTLQMSWTAWLMLRWGETIFPSRKQDILDFCVPYADFLVSVQHEDGCIPSWFGTDGKPSRKEFRDFNAETVTSGMFLMEIGQITGKQEYLDAGMKAVDFITKYVFPRQRWFDLETFLSCSKKTFDCYDSITAQYPQCNLSEIHASIAYLRRYQITRDPKDLQLAEQMVDYLLLTQQVWNHPILTINTFGGFTVQNGDNEWNDARQGLCSVILYHYFLETGKREYLERSIAACHAGFEMLPYENWAHCGYEGMQYDSSLLWGGGVSMTAAEYLQDALGTMVVCADESYGIGIDGCVVSEVTVSDNRIDVKADVSRLNGQKPSVAVFSSAKKPYEVFLNGTSVGVCDPAQPVQTLS
jgi:hypothetical protein